MTNRKNKKPPQPLSDKVRKIMEEEMKTVTGIFRFHECPGSCVKIPMKKYPGKVYNFDFMDGEEYTVPLWVARWLNGYDKLASARNGKIDSCGYPIHENCVDRVTGKTLVRVGQIRRRMGFESNEFMVA